MGEGDLGALFGRSDDEGRGGELGDEAQGAAGGIGDELDGSGGEDGVFGAGLAETVAEIIAGGLLGEFAQVAEAGDALAQGFMDGEAELVEELGGAQEDAGEGGVVVEMVVGEEADGVEGAVGSVLHFIEDEDGVDGLEFAEAGLDGGEDGAFAEGGLGVEAGAEGFEEIVFGEMGEGEIDDFVGGWMEGVGEIAEESGFADPGATGDGGETAEAEEVGEVVEAFLAGIVKEWLFWGLEEGSGGEAEEVVSDGLREGIHGYFPGCLGSWLLAIGLRGRAMPRYWPSA
jgi:hypothetical protein